MGTAFVVFVFIHAAAHVVGFLNQTFLVGVEDPSLNKAFLLGGFERGHPLVRSLGALWLVVAVAFVLAGIGLLQETDWAVTALVVATAASMVLSIIWVKEAPFGLVANVVIIAVLVIPALSDRMIDTAARRPPSTAG